MDFFCWFSLQHETASVQMFDHLVKVNGLEEVMEHHGLRLPDDLIFIKEQIAGPLDNSVLDRSVCKHVIIRAECCLYPHSVMHITIPASYDIR